MTDTIPKTNDSVTGENPYYKVLGYYESTIYIYSYQTAQIIEFSAIHTPRSISQILAPLNFWEKKFIGLSGAKFKEIIVESIIRESQRVGMFNPSRIRGRGAWLDRKGNPVIHLGDKIITDNKCVDIKDFKTTDGDIYLANYPLGIDKAEPLSDDECIDFIKLCDKLTFNDAISGKLLAGWIMCAPLCGALKWRSHIYMTGQAGSGKSFVLNSIIKGALGNVAIEVQGNTSEAGIRQAIGQDARPIIFDEFDPQGQFQRERLQEIVGLARQASTPNGAPIIKGSQGQSGAISYHVRSCFCLSSIEVFIKDIADRQRFTMLRLHPNTAANSKDVFKEIQRECKRIITPDFPSRLLARGVSLITQIRENQSMFADEGEVVLGKRRIADQLSMMLSGLYALQYDDFIEKDKAKKWLEKHDWSEQRQLAGESKEYDLLEYILNKVVEIPLDNGGRISRMVSEVVYLATETMGKPGEKLKPEEARAIINRWGMRIVKEKLAIAKKSDFIKNILKDSHWSYPCHEILQRIPGIETSGVERLRFAGNPEYFIIIPKEFYYRPPETEEIKEWEE